jgi:hypothetical protein
VKRPDSLNTPAMAVPSPEAPCGLRRWGRQRVRRGVAASPPDTTSRAQKASIAPRGGKTQVPAMRIHVEYALGAYFGPGVPAGTVRYTLVGARHSQAPDPMLSEGGRTEDHTPGKGRSKKRGATVFNRCS